MHILSLRALAPLVSTLWFIGAVVVLLILWAVISGICLAAAAGKVKRAFNQATIELNKTEKPIDFAINFEAVAQSIQQIALLAPAWNFYRESLIIPHGAGKPILATSPARPWFDLPSLFRAARSDLRYHAALPGLLVGAGLLFTFLGLTVALSAASGVVAEGVSQSARNEALRELLGAASVKFITSLAGLSLSIGYALWRKGQLKRAETASDEFLGALQHRLPFRTAAALQADSNAITEKQFAQIQQIGSDFFVNLGSTLERSFDSGLQQHIAPLAVAIETLSTGLANQNENAMEAMLKEFLGRLEGAVGESMRGTAETMNHLGARLDGLRGGLDEAAQRMGRAAEEMAVGMGRGAESALGGITEQMAALVHSLRDAAEEAGRNNRAAGDDMARQMADTAAALSRAVTSFQERMEDGAAQGIGRLAGPIEALLRQLDALATGQRQAGAEASEALAATIGRAATALEATAENIAAVLGGGAADASARLIAATEAMRDDLREVLERVATTLADSGTTLRADVAAGGQALLGAAGTLGSEVSATAASLRAAGEAAGRSLREGGSEAGAGMNEAARLLSARSGDLAGQIATLGTAGLSLADRVASLDSATRAATTPLAAGAADLRAAGEAAREAALPLADVARTIGAALDLIRGAVAALAGAQGNAGDLASRLGDATDRFAGLDKAIAGTLTALMEGVGNLENNLTGYVTGIDKNFAGALNNLNAMVSSLQNSVEELSHSQPARKG